VFILQVGKYINNEISFRYNYFIEAGICKMQRRTISGINNGKPFPPNSSLTLPLSYLLPD